MKKTISSIIITLLALCVQAQDLYIGTFYVTSTDEEALYGDGADKWAKRKPVICEMLKFEEPDVVGLQSATASQLAQIKSGVGTYNLAGDILYAKALELDSTNVVDGLPEGNTCTWAKLRKDGKAFYVFNFCFEPTASTALTSATTLVNAVTAINTEKLPVFLLGDLGVSETKTAYSRLKLRYEDCYTKATFKSAEYGTKNNFDLDANHGTERFDFIFVSKTITVKAYGQLQYGYFTQESDGKYKRRLPSTHFPVMAKVTLP